jgi:hypothetical protein
VQKDALERSAINAFADRPFNILILRWIPEIHCNDKPVTITTGANMEQMQFDEAGASAVKKQAGQSGIDANIHRRNRRVEIRFSSEEREELAHRAIDAGYTNLAQYLREVVMKLDANPADSNEQAWLQNINRFGNYIAEIAGRLDEGEQPHDEILLAVMQVQEYAEDVWKTVKQGRDTDKA